MVARRVLTGTVILLMLLVSPAAAAIDRVPLCHFDDEAGLIVLVLPPVAVEHHLTRHDHDRLADQVDGCSTALQVFARAFSITEDGGEVLIAALVDGNGDGAPGPGDRVVTDQYPRSFDADDFGQFRVTEHEVAEVLAATPGRVLVVATTDARFLFEATVEGAPGERYLEEDDDGFADFRDDGGAGAHDDGWFVLTTAPSEPVEEGGMGRVGVCCVPGTDDDFLEVEIALP